MIEKAIQFGQSSSLVGVLSEPSPEAKYEDGPAIIMLNSGILHRVGSCRLYVKAARRLARSGLTVLRFDHSGVGDSEHRAGTQSFEEAAQLEVQEAMKYLEQSSGQSTFVLMGLCSGSDVAFYRALDDERVVGIVQLDAYCYRTLRSRIRYFLGHYGPRVLRSDVWHRFFVRLRSKITKLFGSVTKERQENWFEAPEYVRVFPSKSDIAKGLNQLLARNVKILTVFSGGDVSTYNYQSQFADSFRSVSFKGNVQVEYLESANHIFTGLQEQDYVLDCIDTWFSRNSFTGDGA